MVGWTSDRSGRRANGVSCGVRPMNCPICGHVVSDDQERCPSCGSDLRVVSAELLSDEEVAIHPVRVGDVLANRWKIERKIGRGGMAAVFLARDQEQSRKVAVKVLRSAYCADPIFVARFEREARITA